MRRVVFTNVNVDHNKFSSRQIKKLSDYNTNIIKHFHGNLKKVAEFKANILTIHQTIPVNGIASLTLSVDILPTTGDSSEMIEQIERLKGVRYLKILSSDASI